MGNALEVVKTLYGCYEQDDLDGFIRMCDDNIEWVINGPANLEQCQTYIGIAGVKQFLNILDNSYIYQSFIPNRFFVDQSTVIVLGQESAKERESGKNFQSRWVHVFDIENDKVVRFKEFLCRWNEGEVPPEMSW